MRLAVRLLLLLAALGAAMTAHAFGHGTSTGALSKRQAKRWTYGKVQDPKLALASKLDELHELAKAHPDKVKIQAIGAASGLPIYRVELGGGSSIGRKLRVLVSAGVHGNEPTGVLAAIELAKRAMKDRGLTDRFELTILPAVNPTGLVLGTRSNDKEQDLNRSFPDQAHETGAITQAIGKHEFDLFVDLHGAKGNGFFLIRGADDGDVSRRILSAMGGGGLLAKSHLDVYTLHTPGGVTSSNAGTFKDHMLKSGARYSYTLEYPRTLSPKLQLSGLLKLLRSTMDNVRTHGQF